MSEWNDKVIEELRANGGTAAEHGWRDAAHPPHHRCEERSGAPVAAALPRAGRRPRHLRSYAGAPVNPAWFHNLVAHPDVTVEIGGETRSVRARVACREERDELYDWNKQDYETFKEYEARTDRKIPVVILEPVG